MAPVRFAIAYTVKNEARLLRSAIRYHIAAGCFRVYIFWDGTSDGSELMAADFSNIVARNSITPDEIHDPPAWMAEILPSWGTDMDVRKRINTYHAARSAAAEGIDWLASIDPDELILIARNEPIAGDHVTKHLERVPDRIDQLLMSNLESVPTSAKSNEPFADCVYFLNRFPVTEFIWRYSRVLFTRILKSPQVVAWYDYLFYQLRFLGALPRLFREPNSRRRIPAGYFLGYSNFKSFIRLKRFASFNFCTHRWFPFLRGPRNMRIGNVLHFDMPDAAYFSTKFRQRQAADFEKLFHARYRFAIVARNSSDREVQNFFDSCIAVRDPARIALLKKKKILLEIDTASNFFNYGRNCNH